MSSLPPTPPPSARAVAAAAASLVPSRCCAVLSVPAVCMCLRDSFLLAFKTFAWETAASTSGNNKPPQVLRHYSTTEDTGDDSGA